MIDLRKGLNYETIKDAIKLIDVLSHEKLNSLSILS